MNFFKRFMCYFGFHYLKTDVYKLYLGKLGTKGRVARRQVGLEHLHTCRRAGCGYKHGEQSFNNVTAAEQYKLATSNKR